MTAGQLVRLNAMLCGLFIYFLAVVPAIAVSTEAPPVVTVPQSVRTLSGGLNDVPVLNSNSPEVVQQEGILVSTLSPDGAACPAAHLNYAFDGRFDLFVHHISKYDSEEGGPPLYIGLLLANRSDKPVTVDVLAASSYLSQPDAPFVSLPAVQENEAGTVYAGPGDRVSNDILRNCLQPGWPTKVVVPANGTLTLAALPIPTRELTPHLNGRTALVRLFAHGTVYAATLATFARTNSDGSERAPTDEEWQKILREGNLAGPREKPASVPGAAGPVIYGRVAGVSKGDVWKGSLTNPRESNWFHVFSSPLTVSFPISTVIQGTLATGQVQSAPLLVREPDTAFAAHGNYGVEYQLTALLINEAMTPRSVSLALQTPLKNIADGKSLNFYQQQSARVFFRGTVKVEYTDHRWTQPIQPIRFIHLVQHQGEPGQPLLTVNLRPKQHVMVRVAFVYPADATPPQVVTISSAVAFSAK